MVPRPVPTLAARFLLPLLLLGFLPAVHGESGQEPAARAPTDLERILQRAYLDHSFVLRAPVKMQQVRSRRVVSSTVAGSPSLELVRPITVATPNGVFYLSDYSRKEHLASDVRTTLGSPDAVPSEDPHGGLAQTADVVEISGESQVVMRTGELARITGVQEIPGSIQVTLEGYGAGVGQVLVRSGVEIHRPAAVRADAFTMALAHLLFLLPDDPDAWMQADWPENLRTAIREHRVVEEMTREQVLLALGTPLYVGGNEEAGTQVWTYQRGATLREQLRQRTRIYFAGGVVVEVEEDP